MTRDRIVTLERVPAHLLRPNPKNWRTHPKAQKGAMKAMLDDVGFAAPVVARRRDDGQLELVDGHLRADISGEELVPVVVIDVSDVEADKLLATLDPLSAMASADTEKLKKLLSTFETESKDLQALLNKLVPAAKPPKELDFNPALKFQVVIDCENEQHQAKVLTRLQGEGLICKALML